MALPQHAGALPLLGPVCAQRVDVGELFIRSTFCAAGELQQPVGERRPPVLARPCRVGVGGQRGLNLGQKILGDGDLGFAVNAGSHQSREVARPELAVAGHFPDHRPHLSARERLGDIADPGERRLERAGVEAQRTVRVVVVDDDQLVTRNPLCCNTFERVSATSSWTWRTRVSAPEWSSS